MSVTGAKPSLIGRDHPAGVLRAEVGRAAESHGGLVLVAGEAGIGKTTLVAGAVEEARRLGALVLSGSCWDSENAPGYWPWVQLVRGLRRAATPGEWAAAEEAAGSGLAVLLGETRGAGSIESFQLYDAVTTALVAVSQHRPVVAVLDDLHWADTASLQLLEFAAQHTWFERLLLVGTYRDVEVEPDEHPLRPLITPLVAKATTVTLTGLTAAETGTLMERTAGRPPGAALAADVHRRTGGNPFFVEQTARLWHAGGTVSAVAPGVRDALRRRLSLLPAPVERLLTDASVLGREFHRQVLAAAVAAPVPQVDRLLDRAVAARLVVAQGAGRFAFAHDLVREALYDALEETEARSRHAAVVHALDGDAALARKIVPAELARHAHLAGGELTASRAVDHLLAAAQDAAARMAFAEKSGHLRRALARAADDSPRRAVLVGLELGSDLRLSSERDESWQVLTTALAHARELDDPELLARAALTLHRVAGASDSVECERFTASVLAEAHGRLVRPEASGRGGRTPVPGPGDGPEADRLARELAVRVAVLARRGHDDDALSFSLWMRHDLLWGPGTAAEREALTEEMITVARRAADDETELFATSMRWVALLEQGDPRYLDHFRTFVSMAERAGAERALMSSAVDQSVIASLGGRLDEVEPLLQRARDVAEHHEQEHEHFGYMVNHMRWALLLAQGRFEELAELHRAIDVTDYPYPRLLEGITAAQQGDSAAALRHLASLDAVRGGIPRTYAALWLRLQAEAAAVSGDPGLCERARAAITPYADEWAVSLFGCDVSGPMVFWLARLDAAQERWDAAVAGFTAALDSAVRLQAHFWAAGARLRLAEALLARGGPGDAERAAELLARVERETGQTAMAHLAERARGLRAPAAPPAAAPERAAAGECVPGAAAPAEATAAAPAAGVREFRREGAVWTLTFDGRTVHMPDAKGLRDLHTLIGSPGTDIPAVRLLAPAGGDLVVAARQLGGDPVLDEEAKARYKQRLTLLDEEIDRAAQLGDDRRAAAFDEERVALLGELRTAAGLAGRSRRLGDEAERARKTVTARIRDTLRKLDGRHPELAAHLRAGVSTGAACRYQPEHGEGGGTWRL